jgi:hypothetical protein
MTDLQENSVRVSSDSTPQMSQTTSRSKEAKEAESCESGRKHIEVKMYRSLCSLNEIVLREKLLEQYVLRELRHLQEFLYHRFPPIAAYLSVPFEELIQNVRMRTRGLVLESPCGGVRQCNKPVLSPPTPRKRPETSFDEEVFD